MVLRTGVDGFGGEKILLPLPELETRFIERMITLLTTLSRLWAEKSTDRTILLPEELVLWSAKGGTEGGEH